MTLFKQSIAVVVTAFMSRLGLGTVRMVAREDCKREAACRSNDQSRCTDRDAPAVMVRKQCRRDCRTDNATDLPGSNEVAV